MMTMTTIPKRELFFLLSLFSASLCSTAGASSYAASSSSLQTVMQSISRRGQATLTRSVPTLNVYYDNNDEPSTTSTTLEVAVRKKRKRTRRKLLPSPLDLNIPKVADGVASHLKNNGAGFYYGFTPKIISKATIKREQTRRPSLSDSMSEALDELRFLRKEMETMRKEMQTLKRKMIADGDFEEDDIEVSDEAKAKMLMTKKRRQKECEKLAKEIENWAQQLLQETEQDGWKEIECNKMMKKTLNPTGRTTTYIKWMKDSRGDKGDKADETDYPCIKCFSTIDAPLEDVCTFLSQESAMPEYNDLVEKYKDVEDISPNAKICWSCTPQILFVKPRDFVTLCHHRWKGDGGEVVVNQAWDHPDYPATKEEKEGKACRAYALRGANFFSRCPDDPEKTRITIVAHANPGGGLPKWAAKTAVNALTPIEPFKLFHKVNESVKKYRPQLRERLQQAEMVSTLPAGRSPRPAGIAQLGYACFWPNGGGVEEGGGSNNKSPVSQDTNEGPNSEGDENNMGEQSGNSSNQLDNPAELEARVYEESS